MVPPFVFLVLVLPFAVIAIRAAIRSGDALREIQGLREHLARLQERLLRLEGMPPRIGLPEPAKSTGDVVEAGKEPAPKIEPPPPRDALPTPVAAAHPAPQPPPLPSVKKPQPPPPAPAGLKLPELNLEQFMGVKLFAWLGGLALFFGVVFFVKYAFEHNLIPPAARIAIGALVGAGLATAGALLHRNARYRVLAQTLCATGVLVLYGSTFAGRALYHLYDNAAAFAAMSLITAAAFFLAVRLEALVIAILGMVGGFLTPILCSTGEDNPLGLFGYIALLDIGLLAVARVRKWFFLASLGAAGTILMQLAWFFQFFERGRYFEGAATWTPIAIALAFVALFLVAAQRTKQDENGDLHPAAAAMALCGSAMLFAFLFLDRSPITERTGLLYSFVFLINAGVLAGIIINPRLGPAQIGVGLATFAHIALWTTTHLKAEALPGALVVYFLFGVLHSVFPVVWQRLKPGHALALQGAFSPWFPPLALVLMLLPVLSLPHVSFLVWPAILLVDALAILVAVSTNRLLPVLAALLLTLATVWLWLTRVPAEIGCLPPFLALVAVFAAFFAVAGCWLAKRHPAALRDPGNPASLNDQVAAALPVLSAALPFLLLIMAVLTLPVTEPSAVFAVGLGLALLLLGLARVSGFTQLAPAALGCFFALEFCWHNTRFDAASPGTPLAWYLGIYAVFAAFPFVFRQAFRQTTLPWITAALAAVWQGALVYFTAKASYPSLDDKMGLIPAAFALPSLASLFAVHRGVRSEGAARLSQLAWFGGVALLFITLIFPIQFHRQWITLGWALEGAALIWLFRRVPHDGLRLTGCGLLAAAFVRLALNPAVLTYQMHSATPVLNWFLYTYGIAAAATFLGAWWLPEAKGKIGDLNARAVLWAFGGILLFLLLNIEIADCFTPPGSRFITIDLGGVELGRDMTYSIAWGLFALALIVTGFLARARGARYAGIGLMAVTLLKVFFHDLSALESIYRIAALIAVALLALAASFLYQRYFERTEES